MKQFSNEFLCANRMVILGEDEDRVTVGVAAVAQGSNGTCPAGSGRRAERSDGVFTRTDRILRRAFPGRKIEYRRLSDPELMLASAGAVQGSVAGTAQNGGTPASGQNGRDFDITGMDSLAPVVTVLNGLLLEARSASASDIHLELDRKGLAVRIRKDGVLRPSRTFGPALGKALVARIKLMANLNTLETRRPQDGRFTVTAGGIACDIRVSAVPSVNGESVALRFLDSGPSGFALEALGFPEPAYRALAALPGLPDGLVLVTGPTGSGKTTTLSALIMKCDTASRKVISIEDPVECVLPGVTQIQTNENLGLGFGALLRRILRQDPDVIMIGEIRDGETAELAVRAALTGHLVFSTLHTGSAREARTRLCDLGVPPYLADTVLRAVIGQRLLRRCCAACGGRGTGGDGRNDEPCVACRGSGFSGRIPVAEIFLPREVRGDEGRTTKVNGLRGEARRLAAQGLTTEAEAVRILGKGGFVREE